MLAASAWGLLTLGWHTPEAHAPLEAARSGLPPRYAYVSTLCGGRTYLPAALVLGSSLRRTNTTADMVLMVTGEAESDTAALRRLEEVGWRVRRSAPDRRLERPGVPAADAPRWRCFFHKLSAFNLTEYETVVLMDADTAVFQPIDALFDALAPTPPEQIAAVPNDRYPGVEINSGVLVLKPLRETADALARHVSSGAHIEFDGADQGLINQFFFGKIRYLPPFYNMMPSATSDQYTMDWLLEHHPEAVRVVHYADNKPFWCGRDTECSSTRHRHIVTLGGWWWRLFDRLPWRPAGEDIQGRPWGGASVTDVDSGGGARESST